MTQGEVLTVNGKEQRYEPKGTAYDCVGEEGVRHRRSLPDHYLGLARGRRRTSIQRAVGVSREEPGEIQE
jgi:hypothetical protein